MKFKSGTIIDDAHEALGLLVHRWGSRIGSQRINLTDTGGPHIEIHHIGGAYDMEVIQIDHYRVTSRVVEELKARGLVEGTPYWGGTRPHELQISELGAQVFWTEEERRRQELRKREEKEHENAVAALEDEGGPSPTQ